MKRYELALVLHPDLEIDLKPVLSKIEGLVTSGGGEIKSVDNWGKQKLAYPISKQAYGIYVFYTLELASDKLAPLEARLRIEDEVLRHLLTTVDLRALEAVAQNQAKVDNKAKARSSNGA